MTTNNKHGTPLEEGAAKNPADDQTRVLMPNGGLLCTICSADIVEADIVSGRAEMLPVVAAGPFTIAVGICHSCIARAVELDGSTDQLVADIQASYPQALPAGVLNRLKAAATAPPARQQQGAQQLALRRRAIGTKARRHPAFGAKLVENPPSAGETLHVLVGWQAAKLVPEPKVVVRDDDKAGSLRFDAAAGRRCRLIHPADVDPERLLHLAQELIDFGALEVEAVIYPPPAGSARFDVLVFRPEAAN